MSKALFAIALVALVGAAAAVEADTASKKHYKPEHEAYEYKEGHGHVKHVEFDVFEEVGSTYPSSTDFEIIGATVTQEGGLTYGGNTVGSFAWSGIVVKSKGSADCEEYSKKHHPRVVEANYEVTLEFTVAQYAGQIVTGIKADSIFSDVPTTLAVLGGTGAFTGASGTVTWTAGVASAPGKYEFDLWIPKAHEGEEYEGKEHYSYYGKKHDKY